MPNIWSESEIQRYIDDEEEESLTLDYKAASALAKSDGKKTEITIAVSAMANSAGGIIIYGLREHPTARHKAEKLDPIDRTQFSKEWLEHVINNIRPRLNGVIIHPVSLATGPNDVAYVVEIPQSNTAHQANDKRYYRRFNFECVPMEDFEIRDIMNRATIPDVEVEFKYMKLGGSAENRLYRIHPVLANLGTQVVNNFKLEFIVPRPVALEGQQLAHPLENVQITLDSNNDYVISYQSKRVLFPHEVRNLGEELLFPYRMNRDIYGELRTLELNGQNPTVEWTLYADNMPPKTGSVLFRTLHDF
jgi:hypothetical protein